MLRFAPILIALIFTGCAKYAYDIVDPPTLAPRIGHDQDVTFQTAAAEYVCRAAGDRLVMLIYNRGEGSLRIDGSRSTIISPDGQSRPVIPQTIAPDSFIKLVLPPPLPIVETSPSFYYGFYFSTAGNPHHHHGHHHDRGDRYHHGPYRPYRYGYYGYDYFWYDSPSFTVYDTSNPMFWEWRGQTQITLTLAYERDGAFFEDRFIIQRRRVD